MAVLKIDLDRETYTRLLDSALHERRPIPWQAEILLRRALGLPFPPVKAAHQDHEIDTVGDTQE